MQLRQHTSLVSQLKKHSQSPKPKDVPFRKCPERVNKSELNKLIVSIILQMLIASAFVACAFAGPQDYSAIATKQDLDITPEGAYRYAYETSNGIAAQEQGQGGYQANGGFSWYSPDGELVQITYVADENGYQPQGAALPTPPPIPAAILKSLEYIRTHPQYEEPQQQQQQFRRPAQSRKIFG